LQKKKEGGLSALPLKKKEPTPPSPPTLTIFGKEREEEKRRLKLSLTEWHLFEKARKREWGGFGVCDNYSTKKRGRGGTWGIRNQKGNAAWNEMV